MNKIQEIYEMLEELAELLSKKRENEEKKHGEANKHTEGQLYEVNYILERFWEIVSRK